MKKIVVVTDSVACLPKELTGKYAIEIVPITLIVNGQSYRDRIDMTPQELYDHLLRDKSLPTTSAPSPWEILQVYRKIGAEAAGIVFITVSSKLSLTFDSARQAKLMAEKEITGIAINVVDSETAAGAQGFVALAAARAAASGGDLTAVTEAAQSMKPRANLVAVLDTLYYLAKGGRIMRPVAWMGSLLKIKPILDVAHGEVNLLEKSRTSPRAVQRLVEIMKERTQEKPVHVNIMHANAPEEAEKLKSQVMAGFDCVELFITEFTPVMGIHCGPGVLALAFYVEGDSDVA
ncbi:DegV family protein [Chloroflexota bacterium]